MRFLVLILLFLPLCSFSQVQKVSKFIELGVSPLSYKGDLSQGYQKWTSAFHLGLKRNTKNRLNGHFNLMVGTLTGQNINYTFPSSATPNSYFKTTLVALNYDVQFNIIKKDHFILYISQGVGLLRFITRDQDNTNLADKFNTRAKDESYNNISFFFPHALGFMYFLPNNYGAGLQIGRLSPATDYLDNISKLSNYKKPDNILSVKFTVLAPLTYKKETAP